MCSMKTCILFPMEFKARFTSAALGGIVIPLGLIRLGVDPAIASGPFVTTVTDVVGFFSFLGLATVFARFLATAG